MVPRDTLVTTEVTVTSGSTVTPDALVTAEVTVTSGSMVTPDALVTTEALESAVAPVKSVWWPSYYFVSRIERNASNNTGEPPSGSLTTPTACLAPIHLRIASRVGFHSRQR